MFPKPVARVVYLVDNKRRDLAMAALIAYQLELQGIECRLEPLESYRAVLAADRPDMIIFNHLVASHLARYSQRLHREGVLVAVLPNEGILYKEEVLKFNAGRFHNSAHIDLFFAWNEAFRDALTAVGMGGETRIEVVGVPRFDYYFPPWSALHAPATPGPRTRPRVLVCTNFVFAKYGDLPPHEATQLFKDWARRIDSYQDYQGAVQVSHRNRERLFGFLDALLEDGRFDVVLRPHPNEEADWYAKRIALMPSHLRDNLTLDAESNITGLILNCDLEISMDSCTTALECWIAGKPTLDLELERHPMLTNPMLDPLNLRCNAPEELPRMVAEQLANPTQAAYRELREAHLARWCASPAGNSAERTAKAIADSLEKRKLPRNIRLTFSDRRRGLKLKLLRNLGKPYNWQPQLALRALLNPTGTFIKQRIYGKTITPGDVCAEIVKLRRLTQTSKIHQA